MNKTMKKIAVFAVVTTLAAGSIFAQPKNFDKPGAPVPGFEKMERFDKDCVQGNKLLGIIEETTNNSLSYIDMDGKKVTVLVTPFTTIQDIEKAKAVDPSSKDARTAMNRTFLSLNQMKKGFWVKIQAYRTEEGKLVAENIQVIRMLTGVDGK